MILYAIFLLHEIAAQDALLATGTIFQKSTVHTVIAIFAKTQVVTIPAVIAFITELTGLQVTAIDAAHGVLHDIRVVAIFVVVRVEQHVTVLVVPCKIHVLRVVFLCLRTTTECALRCCEHQLPHLVEK
jgi:hypothetical protein